MIKTKLTIIYTNNSFGKDCKTFKGSNDKLPHYPQRVHLKVLKEKSQYLILKIIYW